MAKADPERLAAWATMRRTHDVVRRTLEVALLAERDLPLAWFDVLEALRLGRKGRLQASELAEVTFTANSTLSRQLDRLEERGLVQRERSSHDARIVIVAITSEGRDVLRGATTTYTRVTNRSIAAAMSDADVVAIQQIAERVLAD